jgi:hypothetical protein
MLDLLVGRTLVPARRPVGTGDGRQPRDAYGGFGSLLVCPAGEVHPSKAVINGLKLRRPPISVLPLVGRQAEEYPRS